MCAMSSSSDLRPGQDPSCPHQDLRIPSQFPSYYLNQSLPSTSLHLQTLSTPPVAVQIASLHRAAEVARFEWRASQRQILAERQLALSSLSINTADVRHYQLVSQQNEAVPSNRSRNSARNPTSNQTLSEPNRVYSSSLDAYISAARELSRANDTINAENDNDDLEEYFTDDFSDESDSTESEVLASTLRPTQERRRQSTDQDLPSSRSQSGILPNRGANLRNTNQQATSISAFTEEYSAESQVWDRMVEDLAIGAGIGGRGRNASSSLGTSPYSRGISAGIAASMLALSASIPRPELQNTQRGSSSNPSRLLPHPIWARRYPGAAGEWLRGELARRASTPVSNRQQNATLLSTSNNSASTRHTLFGSEDRFSRSTDAFDDIFSNPRTRDRTTSRIPASSSSVSMNSDSPSTGTASSPWSVLRFPSLDPTMRSGIRSTLPNNTETPPVATIQSDSSSNTLAVPSNPAALAPTPPPGLTSETQPLLQSDQSTSRPSLENSENNQTSTRSEAAELVARMAQMLRDRNARNASDNRTTSTRTANEGSSRAVRGGMEYIRSLRAMDGSITSTGNPAAQRTRRETIPSPPRPSDVFPWYTSSDEEDLALRMSSLRIANTNDEDVHDPNGTSTDWYQMIRARMASQSVISAGPDPTNDPNGETIEEANEQHLRVRRRILTASNSDATQRQRNRSARVMVDAGRTTRQTGEIERSSNTASRQQNNNADFWNVVDGWTVINPRPSSPVRHTRDEGSENVTTWTHAPALSASPGLIDHAQEVEEVSGSRERTGDDLRSTRPIRRLPSLTAEDVSFSLDDDDDVPSSNGRRTSVEVEIEGQDNSRSGSMPSLPIRRAEFSSGRLEERQFRTSYREGTPSPEPRRTAEVDRGQITSRIHRLSTIGARLEEEFRARQGELREREQRLRSEVARRRMELDQLRQQQGRIGRVVERSRRDRDEEHSINGTYTIPSEEENFSPSVTRVNESVNPSNQQPTPSTSTSLVRRRTMRDSAPSLRPFRRAENRRSLGMPMLNETTNRQMTLNTVAANRALQSVQRHSIYSGRLRRSRSQTSLTRTPPTVYDQRSLDDNMNVFPRGNDSLQSISPSISIDNVDSIGTSGLALMSFVDALAAPYSIIRAQRFEGLPMQMPTVMQPTLPSTLDDTVYPLRFDFVGGQQSKTGQSNCSQGGSSSNNSSSSGKLSNVLLNDESTCPVASTHEGVHINLKFLAATYGMTHQLRVSEHSTEVSTRQSEAVVYNQNRNRGHDEPHTRSYVVSNLTSQMLSKEEQESVQQCLKEAKKNGSVELMTSEELFVNAGEAAKALLEKRKDSLCRLPWFGPFNVANLCKINSTLMAAQSVPSFCLSRLTVKVPHRTTVSAEMFDDKDWPIALDGSKERPIWMFLVFVSWNPISVTDLKEYEGFTQEDVLQVVSQYGRQGPGLRSVPDFTVRCKRPSTPFDEDEKLGDPNAMKEADGKGKQNEEQKPTEQGPRPNLLPVGLGFLELSQATLDFDNLEYGTTETDSTSNSNYLGTVRGVSGKYLALKVMLTTIKRTKTPIDLKSVNLPELEIQYIGAHGYAGPRSFGDAGWKD